MQINQRIGKEVAATLRVDTKSDISDNLAVGDDEIGFGSVAITNAGEIGQCGSDRSWTWVE